MNEKQERIKNRFSHEICEINYILQGLYDERIYGYNGNQSRSDGTIQTNVTKLIKYLNEIADKIEADNGIEKTDSKDKTFKILNGNK